MAPAGSKRRKRLEQCRGHAGAPRNNLGVCRVEKAEQLQQASLRLLFVFLASLGRGTQLFDQQIESLGLIAGQQ